MEREIDNAIADPRTYADMDEYHGIFERLRREDPIHWTEPDGYRPFWTVSCHADIIEIERQPKLFISAPRTALRSIEQEDEIFARTGSTQASHTLIQMDDPQHAKFRKLTQAWFMPPALKAIQGHIDELAEVYVDRLIATGGACDFAQDVAIWYPLRAIMLILGVPEEDEPLMLRLTQQHFGGTDPSVNGGKKLNAAEAAAQVFAYFTKLTDERRKDPRNDIVSLLANAEVDGEPISDYDRNSYYFVLALAGHDTTSSTISGLVHELAKNPDQYQRLREDRSLLESAIEEGLRYTSPVRHFFRTAAEDYEIRGKTIKAGDSVLVAYPSGNFDEAVFDAPQEFRIDRQPNRQIAFGFGVHQCLGQHLAKMEMRAFFNKMLDRVTSVELAGQPKFTEASFVSGLKSLPIRFEARTLQDA